MKLKGKRNSKVTTKSETTLNNILTGRGASIHITAVNFVGLFYLIWIKYWKRYPSLPILIICMLILWGNNSYFSQNRPGSVVPKVKFFQERGTIMTLPLPELKNALS